MCGRCASTVESAGDSGGGSDGRGPWNREGAGDSRGMVLTKWSPSWEGPYRITQVIIGNAYMLQNLQGEDLSKALNGCFLKQYHPSMWQDT
jgi:hypothetical protein